MPRRRRPAETTRSEHWLRMAVNEKSQLLDALVISKFKWTAPEKIQWLSPIREDAYAEYYDEEFLNRLQISDLKVPLNEFWPKGGPPWDGLAKTKSGKILLVEAKAYAEEAVDYRSRAKGESLKKIQRSLSEAKSAYRATEKASWEQPFYQYANHLAHLFFLHKLNRLDAYLLFLYFADAPDVPTPTTVSEWKGSIRIIEKCLGLGKKHPFRNRVRTMIVSVPDMLQ